MKGFFFNDDFSTPDAIDRRRALINALSKENLSTAPVQHWTQALARVMGSAADGYEGAKLNEAEKKGTTEWSKQMLALFGGGAPTQLPGAAPADPAGSSWNGDGQQVQSVSRETAPPAPVPQQPLLPNRPQMPEGPNIFERVGGMIPEAMGQAPATPSPFGTINQSISTNGNNAPLWTQPGLTKGVPGIGTMPTSPSLAFQEPGPMAPMGGGTQMAGGGDATFRRMLTQESGNRQFRRDGSPVTSSAGAIGIAQVMPATGPEAAKLAGLPWDPVRFRNDAKYNEALGRAYFDAQNRTFNDPIAAAAAYNAGPGRVNQAIARQEQTGQPYTDFLPRETQDYITKVGGPDLPAPGAQTAEQPMQRPAPGQFVNPMQGGGQMQRPGVNPALLQALSSPWAAKNPMLAQLGAKIAGDQLTGTQFGFQVVGDQMYRTNPRTGQVEPVGVSAQKPMIIPEGGTLFDPNTKQVLATGGNKDTPDLKNYQEAVKGGFKGSFTDYQIALRRATSSQPESTFNTEVAKSQAKEFGEMAGELPNAKTDIANIKSLRAQLERLPGGFLGNAQAAAVRLGIKIGPNASAVEAADAILARLTPAQRQGMPGAASDRDVAMFRAALPSLGQTKEGQRIIMDTMEGLAQYKLAQAEIAQQARLGKIKPEQAMERLSTIPDPFEQFRNIQGQTPQGAAPAGTPGQVQTITRDQYQALPSGSKFIAADDPTKTVRTKP